ncbi:hypothetical protein F5146DRAFT_1012983 [Armillaria mellea]|nr:hypothetical protein F5146DRAFT_1012983 [Armillaria mellea]
MTSDTLGVLSKSKNLEEYGLQCELPSLPFQTLQSYQKLQTLTLSSWKYEYLESILPRLLDALVVPHLSNLKVHCCVNHERQHDTDETFKAIRGLISRSQSPLTTFHFTQGDIDEENFLALFRSASSTLQEVHLHDVGPNALTDGILTLLVISNADNVLLPRLHTLNISGVMQFDTSLFVKMVVSRWTCELLSFSRLQTINLCPVFTTFRGRSDGASVCCSVLNQLDKYSTEGLKLTYRDIWASDLPNILI